MALLFFNWLQNLRSISAQNVCSSTQTELSPETNEYFYFSSLPGFSNQLLILAVRFLCCAFISLAVVYQLYRSALDKHPASKTTAIPGPRWSLPILGTLTFVRQRWFEKLSDLRRAYGDVYALRIGCRKVVVLCGLKTVRGALIGEGSEEGKKRARAFAGRPDLHTFQLASEGRSMCFNSYSPSWIQHHRLAERAMKEMHTNGHFWENVVSKEAMKLRDIFLQHASVPDIENVLKFKENGEKMAPTTTEFFNPRADIMWSISRSMYQLCYAGVAPGEDLSSNKPGDVPGKSLMNNGTDYKEMIERTTKLIDCHSRGNVFDFFPWTRRFLRKQELALEALCAGMVAITRRKHADHATTYRKDNIRDIQDALIRHGVNNDDCTLDEDQILMTVQEFIGAGLDITYASLIWIILYVSKYPLVQRAIQSEIDSSVSEGSPHLTAADVRKLPYTEAVVLEVLRHASVVPLALPHSTIEDTELNGIRIPRDTFVMINLHSVNHDKTFWDNPAEFNPDRFLEIDETSGCRVVRKDRCFQFGFGKRKCVGADFSRTLLLLYIGTILRDCALGPPAVRSVEQYSLEPQLGIVLKPRDFFVTVRPRSSRT